MRAWRPPLGDSPWGGSFSVSGRTLRYHPCFNAMQQARSRICTIKTLAGLFATSAMLLLSSKLLRVQFLCQLQILMLSMHSTAAMKYPTKVPVETGCRLWASPGIRQEFVDRRADSARMFLTDQRAICPVLHLSEASRGLLERLVRRRSSHAQISVRPGNPSAIR